MDSYSLQGPVVEQFDIPTIAIDRDNRSVFSRIALPKKFLAQRFLSPQIATVNMRLRESNIDYSSDFHVAGDPTFIAVLQGIMCLYLQDGSSRRFTIGDYYIAGDFMLDGVIFDPQLHGHRAEVLGDVFYRALHIKLPDEYRQTI